MSSLICSDNAIYMDNFCVEICELKRAEEILDGAGTDLFQFEEGVESATNGIFRNVTAGSFCEKEYPKSY